MNYIVLAGFRVISSRSEIVLDILRRRFCDNKKSVLLFANANFIVQCNGLQSWLMRDDVILVNDGVAVDLVARLFLNDNFLENLNGTDFCPRILSVFMDERIFLFGGRPGIASCAGKLMVDRFGIDVCGVLDGYSEIDDHALVCKINSSGADILFVALGNPKQELWIRDNLKNIDAKIIVGVGAFFDFFSGSIPRAPVWIRRLRMEWFYRLILEPRRLLKRYTIDILKFFVLVYKNRDSNRH